MFKGSQEQCFSLQTLLFTAFLVTVLKNLTYALVSTRSLVSSGWEHVKRKMHPCDVTVPIFAHHTKAVKLLFNLPRASHLSPTLHQQKILKPEQIIMREHVKLVQSHRMKRLPQPIASILKPVENNLEVRMNRNSENDMLLPAPSVIAGRHFPAYQLARSWNSLPHSLKSIALHDFEGSFAAHIANLNDKL